MRMPFSIAVFVAVTIAVMSVSWTARAADLVAPDPSITPEEVVAIQMKALQFNDNPVADFGIAQTWNFAHPRNRVATGPLQRFATMLKGAAYGAMLNHASHRIVPQAGDGSRASFDVFMETTKGPHAAFHVGCRTCRWRRV